MQMILNMLQISSHSQYEQLYSLFFDDQSIILIITFHLKPLEVLQVNVYLIILKMQEIEHQNVVNKADYIVIFYWLWS